MYLQKGYFIYTESILKGILWWEENDQILAIVIFIDKKKSEILMF